MPGGNEIIRIGAEQAQVIAGGAVGAALRIYLRPAGSWARSIVTASLCVGTAGVFGHDVRSLLPLNAEACGAVVALVCFGVAEGVLKAVERFDFGALIKRRAE